MPRCERDQLVYLLVLSQTNIQRLVVLMSEVKTISKKVNLQMKRSGMTSYLHISKANFDILLNMGWFFILIKCDVC